MSSSKTHWIKLVAWSVLTGINLTAVLEGHILNFIALPMGVILIVGAGREYVKGR